MRRSWLQTRSRQQVKAKRNETRRSEELAAQLASPETVGREALSNSTDPLTALSALYQGEKTDASSVFNTAMAMMGVAVAYLIGAVPFVEKVGNGTGGWGFLLLLPMPLWLIVTFHSLMTLNAMSHGTSVRIIEDALFTASQLRVERNRVGSAAGDRIMDITRSKTIHKLATVVVYGGVGFLVIGFTTYVLYYAWNVILVRAALVEIAIGTYVILMIIVALSWRVGLRMIGRDAKGPAVASD
jgi:hypothetical protein